MIDLKVFANRMQEATLHRQINGANIKVDTVSMLKHTATEVIEATEAYSDWQNHFDGPCSLELEGDFIGELADIIACVLIICAIEGVDMEVALKLCLDKNEKRAEGKGDKK